MHWWTSGESYGDFTDGWNRIYLTQLPVRLQSEHTDRLRLKSETSSSEYGAFYEKNSKDGLPEYKINRSFYLPPINRRPRSPRTDARMYDDPRDSLRLDFKDIRDINIEMKTFDRKSVILNPTGNGFNYKTNPINLDHIRLPDIRDVNINLRRTDGSVFTVPNKCHFFS